MVDAPGTEPSLRDLETAPLAEQHIGGRDPDIIEKNFGVTMRRLVVTKDRQHPLDDDAGMRQRHQYHRLPPVTVRAVGMRIEWLLSDTGERVTLNLENSTLTCVLSKAEAADVSVTTTRAVLETIALEPQRLAEALATGESRVTGDAAKLAALFAMLDDFKLMFEIVTPGDHKI